MFPRSYSLGSGAVLFACLTMTVATAEAGSHHGEKYGYHLMLPDDWVQIPADMVAQMVGLTQNQQLERKPKYDAMFQPEAHVEWFTYPYAGVYVVSYADFGLKRQPRERELSKIVKALTGMDVMKEAERQVSDEARSFLGEMSIQTPVFEKERRRVLMGMSMSGAHDEKRRAMIAGYFGREALVCVAFYGPADDWDKHDSTRRAIIDSFRFDAHTAYDEALASGGFWSDTLSGSARGGIIGGVVGALVAATVAARKKRSANRT